jgi:hypothetical protein
MTSLKTLFDPSSVPPATSNDDDDNSQSPVDEEDESQHLEALETFPAQGQTDDPDAQRPASIDRAPSRRRDAAQSGTNKTS